MAADWKDVAAADDVSEDMPLGVKIGERHIGIYRIGDQHYALEDICPHAYALLSQGFVEGREIECPLHGARFDIPSGRCTREPGGHDLTCYPVKVDGGRVFIKDE